MNSPHLCDWVPNKLSETWLLEPPSRCLLVQRHRHHATPSWCSVQIPPQPQVQNRTPVPGRNCLNVFGIFIPKIGEMFTFLSIFFRWVGEKPPTSFGQRVTVVSKHWNVRLGMSDNLSLYMDQDGLPFVQACQSSIFFRLAPHCMSVCQMSNEKTLVVKGI